MTELDMCLRLILASILGYIIGLERKMAGKPAGGRTFGLVSLSSAMTMIIGIKLSEIYPTLDPTRISGQIVSGLSFIGIGIIIKNSNGEVIGLTTASNILVICIVGLSSGAGFYLLAITACVLIEVILHLGRLIHKENPEKEDDKE